MEEKFSREKYLFPRATLLSKTSSYYKKAKMNLLGKRWEDKDLIIGCMNGDSFCQKALYDKYASKMFGVCLRYAPDYHTAEDTLQEGFLKVFGSILSFRSEGSFEGWVRRIFVNLSIERYRRTKGIVPFEEVTENTYYLFNEETEAKMDAEELMQLIQALPNGYREVFNLYAIEGYSHSEIAALLDISEGTSKSQLSRARAILRKKINELNSYQHDTIEQLGQLG